jgi:aminopeptidase N
MASTGTLKKIIFSAVIVTLLFFYQDTSQDILLAEINPQLIKEKKQTYCLRIFNYAVQLDDDYISENQRKIDILHYDLSFDLYPEKKRFEAVAIIEGKVIDENLEVIELNFYDNFEITDVKLNNIQADFICEGTQFTVPIKEISIDTFVLKVSYNGTPKKAGLSGFVFGKKNGNSFIYNLSEPNYASTWFPCNDFPTDKALLDMKITNDSSNVSLSNGNLVDVKTNDSRKTYHWKTVYPISTYLIAIYSSDYETFSDEYISLDGTDTLSLQYYVSQEKLEDAKIDFAEHPEYIRFFAETFGEYPFMNEKYGIAEFLWQAGAMEHQTITGVASNIITGSNYFDDVLIHELAHHWWGDAVGPKSWKDIWLNEGFSTYSEALYYEFKSGKGALQSTMISNYRDNFPGKLSSPGSFLFTSTVYNKGAWVMHMLRWEAGDSLFFKILRNYFEEYKYKNASTADFKEICEQVSGKDLDKFFDQWINGEGEIELEYEWESEKVGDKYENNFFLYQVQEEYDTYHFPLEILIQMKNGEEKSYLFEIKSRETQIEIKTDEKVKFVILDPDNWLLMSAREL